MERRIILCAFLLAVAGTTSVFARGGGGCLEKGTPILTPNGATPIENLRVDDEVLCASGNDVKPARVAACVSIEAAECVELRLADRTIRLTAEHPVAVGRGVFRMASGLSAGDDIVVWKDGRFAGEQVLCVRPVKRGTTVFNLLVGSEGTYLADSVLVHNKGCFLPDTQILRDDGSRVAISRIREGDRVMAFREDGSVVSATVRSVISREVDEYFVVTTERAALNVTAEHPFFVGNGTFKTLEILKAGDRVFAFDGKGLSEQRILSIDRMSNRVRVFNLQTDEPNTFFAAGIAVHNKGGGCLPIGTAVETPEGRRNIETLAPGDRIRCVDGSGNMVESRVRSIVATRGKPVILTTGAGRLRATAEHPVCVSKGCFVSAGRMLAGAGMLAVQDGKLLNAVVEGVAGSADEVTVFDLSVGAPFTFIADGVVVHNKGCFLPDTPILLSDGSSSRISGLQPGDQVMAFREDGTVVSATVRSVVSREVDEYFVVTTERAVLNVTGEHPFFVGSGAFKTLEILKAGDRVFAFDGNGLNEQRILSIDRVSNRVRVFNLQTDEPNTFFAAGIAVHNKGGSFHSSSGSRSGSSGKGSVFDLIWFLIVFGAIVFFIVKGQRTKKDEDLDFCYSPKQVARKADKTLKLLQFIAKQDAGFAPAALENTARTVFLKLQECWQARKYDPMQPLMMPNLYNQHLGEINGLIRNHEINRMDGLKIDWLNLVNVRYTQKPNQREFTALITATMRDYYVDDRTGRSIRGDDKPAQFQEFWTFHLQDGKWILREIEQSRESDALKDENFFEQFTDVQVEQVYGEAVDKTGPAGPWLEEAVATKATKIERMLNFLHETDKLWNRQEMIERARQVFADVYMAREAGELPDGLAAQLFPDVAEHFRAETAKWKERGRTFEYRNFCVRKVEIVLVRNFADNSKDEFFTRISAHAQRVVRQGKYTMSEDEYVTPFEEFWTFGRLDKQWKLKEVLPQSRGGAALKQENLDEDSSPEQVQWYYTKKRTV